MRSNKTLTRTLFLIQGNQETLKILSVEVGFRETTGRCVRRGVKQNGRLEQSSGNEFDRYPCSYEFILAKSIISVP